MKCTTMKTHVTHLQLFATVRGTVLLAVIGLSSLEDALSTRAAVRANDTNADSGEGPITGPLRASKNPNYFEDASGVPLILCGSHSWNTLQDWGTDGIVRSLDFDAFVIFLKRHGHNFT